MNNKVLHLKLWHLPAAMFLLAAVILCAASLLEWAVLPKSFQLNAGASKEAASCHRRNNKQISA